MSAVIVPYVPPSYDDGEPRLMIECQECEVEWAWTLESSSYSNNLQQLADEHNSWFHPEKRESNV